jgi:hypothetical protein
MDRHLQHSPAPGGFPAFQGATMRVKSNIKAGSVKSCNGGWPEPI